MRGELNFDAVVIGAGTAGLTAGARLAEAGARVCLLAKGVGSTHLAPGTIDVLGYSPERVADPGPALEELVAAAPDHPYALVGAEAVQRALEWLRERAAAGPLGDYRYVGSLERNHLLPTPVGVLRPSALVPETMAGGDAAVPPGAEGARTAGADGAPGAGADGAPPAGTSLGRVCIVGTRALRDFHPALCAANLAKAGVAARSVELSLDADRADQNALGLARKFDDSAWRAAFCAELALHLRGDERVGLPAMLGIRDPHAVWSDLEHRLGRPVFEIPTLPPSVPGMRLFELLRATLRRAGGRLVLGSEVIGAERDGARITALRAQAAGGEMRYRAGWIVLATGGLHSGAIELDSRWITRERVLGLALRGVPAAGEKRFVDSYLDEQPMARVGVAVDSELRAEGCENVLVAGAALPGAVPWREGSGEGIALSSGFRAAEVVLAAHRGTTEAAA